MKKVLAIHILSVFALFIVSCNGSGSKRGEQYVFPESDSIPVNEAVKLSQEAIEDIVQNISSPVEMASLLQSLEVPFMSTNLAPISDAESLSTSFHKALLLGIYGADLGYLNIYEKTGNAVENLTTIKNLADGIRVGQFFDFQTLKRLAVNKSNLDSLVFMSVHSYNEIDQFLRANNRGYLSALMITGVWLEAQYLACEVMKDYPHEELRNRIGEQKIILNDLLLLLRPYKDSSDEYKTLYDNFEEIKSFYRPVNITYIPGEPETIEKDGKLIVIQNEESIIDITDKQLEDIIMISGEIRNKVISY